MSNSLGPHGLYNPWNSPGKNTGVGSLSLHQGIFPTQGWNPGLPHCRQILYQLSHKGSSRILEWVAYPFSSGSFQPRNHTGVSCIEVDSLPTELSEKPLVFPYLLLSLSLESLYLYCFCGMLFLVIFSYKFFPVLKTLLK